VTDLFNEPILDSPYDYPTQHWELNQEGQPTDKILKFSTFGDGLSSSLRFPNRGSAAYVKNHNLGLEVPYLYGSTPRKYRPDFIVQIDNGHGPDDPLNLIVEIKGYRGEDARDKASTM